MYIDDASSIKFDQCNSQLRRHICTTTGKESWHVRIYHFSYVSKYYYIPLHIEKLYWYISAFSETECQTGFLMLENTCIQYFPDAGLRISDRSQKFCLVNGGGLAKDNIDNDKYNGGNFSDISCLKIIIRSKMK